MAESVKANPELLQKAMEEAKNNETKKIFDVRHEQAIDFGRADTLRYNVLSNVLEEKYEAALKMLTEAKDRPSEYPDFYEKTHRYFEHSIDLVYAIKAKRSFPGIGSLTRAKQQELREKFKVHLKELQVALMRIEHIDQKLRIVDIRSTVYIIRAFWIAAFIVIAFAFAREISSSLATTSMIVFGDMFEKGLDGLYSLLGI